MMIKRIAFFCFGILLFSACKQDTEAANTGTTTTNRTEQEELDFVKTKAISLVKNDRGYWEATFEHDIVMIYIPSGSFTMGTNDISDRDLDGNSPSPAHEVELSQYWICKTPVTIGQFRAFVAETGFKTEVENPSHSGPYVYDFNQKEFTPKKGYYWDNAFKDITAKYPTLIVNDNHPVSCLTWDDCIAFTTWLSGKTGLTFTLPTEAEWERAARGMDERTYPWGNQTPDGSKANYADDTFEQYFSGTQQSVVHKGINDGFAITSPVLQYPGGISPVGAYDMAGNLIEWVYDTEYSFEEDLIKNPIATGGDRKLQKGGFWCGSAGRIGATPNEIKDGHNIRSDSREGDNKNTADDHLGFRIAISYVTR